MDATEAEIDRLLKSFHEDVPMTTQVSLTMSKNSRDILAAIRDEINAAGTEPVFETDDVIRLALLGATRYDDISTEPENQGDSNAEQIDPIVSILAEEVRNDPNFDTEH